MNWRENIGSIEEVYPGHYQIILDFASNSFLNSVLNDEYRYVWVYNHQPLNNLEWRENQLPLTDQIAYNHVLARNLIFDFAMETKAFREISSKLRAGINLVQLNKLPNYYLDLARIQGKTKYDLLAKECDYLFEIDIPSATDYGKLISPNKPWLQSLLDDPSIDWNDLP